MCALREYFAKLARSIQDPDGLALELYSRKMITQSVRDNAVMVTLTKQQKSTILLQAVESKLEANPSDFTTLIAVFQSDPTLMPVAARMIQMYRGQTLEEETPQPPPLPQRKTRERPRETMKETPQPPPLPQQKTQRPIEVRQRNIILLGKSGAGKSTVANHIIGEQRFNNDLCGQPCTCREVSILHMGPGSTQYNFKVSDNIGLFDVDAVERYTNLRRYTSKHFPERFNLVLFVIRRGRLIPEEFRFLTKRYGFVQEISRISALIITHCDDLNDEQREAYVREFHTNPHTKEIADLMGKGIYTVGFPDPEHMGPRLWSLYEEDVKKDEETLHQLIYTCDEQLPLYTPTHSESEQLSLCPLIKKKCIIL